jgi:hypothetical protein
MEMFNRYGGIRVGNYQDEKGVPFFTYIAKCGRCGGAGGSDKWAHTGWTCFDCGGSGRSNRTARERLYTAEKLAKLNATADKRRATKAAAAAVVAAKMEAEAAARREVFEAANSDVLNYLRGRSENDAFAASLLSQADRTAALTDAQIDCVRTRIEADKVREAKRAASDYVGSIKDRIVAEVEVERIYSFERASFGGYGTETVHIVSMRDAQGNMLVSKSPRFCREKGSRLTIKATVKAHSEYQGERQTLVERVAVQ